MFVLLFVGCGQKTTVSIADITYDTEKVDENNIEIKEKLYDLNGNKVLLLTVKNNSEDNYRITVSAKYYRSDGTLLYNENKTFDQFASNYEHNFIFNPGISFDNYTYAISVKECTVPIIAPDLSFSIDNFRKVVTSVLGKGSVERVPAIAASTIFIYRGNLSNIKIRAEFILFDNTGEIYGVYDTGSSPLSGSNDIDIFVSTDGKATWPEEIKGNLSIIYSITQAEEYIAPKIPNFY